MRKPGLKSRQAKNALSRANGVEPPPGALAGVSRRMRYLKRHPSVKTKIKNPEKYLNSSRSGD